MDKKDKNKISRKRFLPNSLTIINMFLGFLAIQLIFKDQYYEGCILIVIAGVMDLFDGKIARFLGISSKFGVEFDSLADMVSFCIFPSMLVSKLYFNGLVIISDIYFINYNLLITSLISSIPLLLGSFRLAKFNTEINSESNSSYFTGLPTPISTMTLISYFLINNQLYGELYLGNPLFVLLLIIFLGILMVSPVRFPKAPLINFKVSLVNSIQLSLFMFSSLMIFFWKGIALFPISILYIIVNSLIHILKKQNKQESRTSFIENKIDI